MSNSFKKGEREAEKWNDKQKALMVPGLQHEVNELREQLAKQEEVIRELTDLLQRLIDGEKSFIKQYPRTSKNIESLLEKAKSLTTKDK